MGLKPRGHRHLAEVKTRRGPMAHKVAVGLVKLAHAAKQWDAPQQEDIQKQGDMRAAYSYYKAGPVRIPRELQVLRDVLVIYAYLVSCTEDEPTLEGAAEARGTDMHFHATMYEGWVSLFDLMTLNKEALEDTFKAAAGRLCQEYDAANGKGAAPEDDWHVAASVVWDNSPAPAALRRTAAHAVRAPTSDRDDDHETDQDMTVNAAAAAADAARPSAAEQVAAQSVSDTDQQPPVQAEQAGAVQTAQQATGNSIASTQAAGAEAEQAMMQAAGVALRQAAAAVRQHAAALWQQAVAGAAGTGVVRSSQPPVRPTVPSPPRARIATALDDLDDFRVLQGEAEQPDVSALMDGLGGVDLSGQHAANRPDSPTADDAADVLADMFDSSSDGDSDSDPQSDASEGPSQSMSFGTRGGAMGAMRRGGAMGLMRRAAPITTEGSPPPASQQLLLDGAGPSNAALGVQHQASTIAAVGGP